MRALAQVICLQCFDVTISIAGLHNGLIEANPVLATVNETDVSVTRIIVFKAITVVIGIFCWRTGRERLLIRANVWYAAVVGWNIAMLLMTAPK
jgi:hypothetical protein